MRNIDQGDWVQKGTVLAVVRQQDYQDKVQQAKAQLARAQADYEKAKLSFDRVSALYADAERNQTGLRLRPGAAGQHHGLCFRSAGPAQRGQCGARRTARCVPRSVDGS